MSKTVKIAETTTSIVQSYKRDDSRIRKGIASKYGLRRHDRVQDLIHNVTKQIVAHAFEKKQAIVLENIRVFDVYIGGVMVRLADIVVG